MSQPSRLKYGVLLAVAIAALGTLGSLYLSIGLGLKACPLCFYQRTFMMSVLAVLIVGLWVDPAQADLLGLLCAPLSIAGLGVASFHEYLETSGKRECPQGIFGLGTAPLQSLIVFIALTAVLVAGSLRRLTAVAGAAVLGILLAIGCVASAPPPPPAPTKPYEQPLEICRPPFIQENAR